MNAPKKGVTDRGFPYVLDSEEEVGVETVSEIETKIAKNQELKEFWEGFLKTSKTSGFGSFASGEVSVVEKRIKHLELSLARLKEEL